MYKTTNIVHSSIYVALEKRCFFKTISKNPSLSYYVFHSLRSAIHTMPCDRIQSVDLRKKHHSGFDLALQKAIRD